MRSSKSEYTIVKYNACEFYIVDSVTRQYRYKLGNKRTLTES